MISKIHKKIFLTCCINPAQSKNSNELACNFSLKWVQLSHKKVLESLKDAFITAQARTKKFYREKKSGLPGAAK